MFPKDCTFISVITEKYNHQSRSLHLIKLQSVNLFSSSSVLYISEDCDRLTPNQGKNHKKEKEKMKEKKKEKMKEKEKGRNNGGRGT